MAKLKVEQKIIDYLNKVVSDESLFEFNDEHYYCSYHFVDRENNIEVSVTDYSYFYDGDWQFPEAMCVTVKKIKEYHRDGSFWTEDIIDSEKWKIPFKTMFKASRILHKLQQQASKNYRARVAIENDKKVNIVKQFAETLFNHSISPKT